MGKDSTVLRLVLLAVVGWSLITPPLLPAMPGLVLGLPVTALYVSIVWLGVIGVLWLILRAGRGPEG